MPAFSRLIRFIASDGRTYWGDAILPSGVTDLSRVRQARVIQGNVLAKDHKVTEQVANVANLLAPLDRSQVGTVRCLGLNYEKHALETGSPIPKYPVLFYKPSTALTGPNLPIPVPAMAQETEGVDYECELVVVIGKEARNVSREKALDYVLGFSVGNDISHREWQMKRGGGQWSLGKGFDGWAPWGPGIVTTAALPHCSPSGLGISTTLNGKKVQDSHTGDLIFEVPEIVSFLSRGVTLLPGDLIFTGTPPGVGIARKPPLWLKDGDVVEVAIEGIGKCRNKVEYEKTKARL